MNHTPRPLVLFVDDEERILRTLAILFRPRCDVLTTSSATEALALLRQHQVHVIVSDQRMPGMLGAELLARAREVSPHTVRILLTGYSDLDAAIEAVNAGEIWRYLSKPWTVESIQNTVRDAAAVASANRATAAVQPPSSPRRHPDAPVDYLLIDSDPETIAAVRASLPGTRELLVAGTLTDAVELLGQRPVGVVITEVMVNGDDMTHLLRSLKQRYPDIVSLVVTSLQDTPRLIRLINQTQVFRYLPKPLRQGMLTRALDAALARHRELRDREHLVPASLRVEDAASDTERTFSRRIGDYLARLKSRNSAVGA